jgi:hypothetical protein
MTMSGGSCQELRNFQMPMSKFWGTDSRRGHRDILSTPERERMLPWSMSLEHEAS